MAVDDPNVVDGLGTDKVTGETVLTISDHLDWSDEHAHLEALQAKLNAYLEFVGSEQVFEHAPRAPVRIDVIGKFLAPEGVRWFFEKVDDVAEQSGITFSYRQLPAGY